LVSDLCCTFYEKLDINLDLGGSQGHTADPTAECHTQIDQFSALKIWESAQKEELAVSQSQCVCEAAMASNSMLTYGGVAPAQGLFGYQPRELYKFENSGLASRGGALETTPDFVEVSFSGSGLWKIMLSFSPLSRTGSPQMPTLVFSSIVLRTWQSLSASHV